MWLKYELEASKVYYWRLGQKDIWVKKVGKIWQIYAKNNAISDYENVYGKIVDEPENPEWKSFISDKSNILYLLPALPDRPIIIKPKHTFKLLPRMNINIYVNIPLWIQFYAGADNKDKFIYELSVSELSCTWFGEPDNGILSYSLFNPISTSLQKNSLKNEEALCPIKIYNESGTTLDFQRLSISVDFLNIYSENNLLYTNEIKVRYKGEKIISEIKYSQQAPGFLKEYKHLSHPRNPEKNNVLRKSFHLIKSLTDHPYVF